MKVALGVGEDYPVLYWREPKPDDDDIYDIPDELWRKFVEAEKLYWELHDKIMNIYDAENKTR